MATRKFSELDAAATLAGTEIIAVTQSGASVRTTATAVANTASSVALNNTGLTVKDTDGSHELTLKPGSNLTADRVLTLVTGDADRTLTLTGDVTLPASLPTSTTDNTIPRFDGTSGSLQTSGVSIDDSNRLTGVAGIIGTVQSLSGAGAINTTTLITNLTTTGANALTLADGSAGQIKIIVMIVDGGDGTLTPTNFGNGTTITFNDVGDAVTLIFTNSKWYILANNGCTVA